MRFEHSTANESEARTQGRRARRIIERLLALALASVGAFICANPIAASLDPARAVAEPDGPLGHAGRWLTDARGRVLIIHGVNMPSKSLPAYPSALGFDADDAAFLADLGFNAVRLTVERYAVEPTAGQFDASYVGHIADTVNLLASYGILSLIDFHQDDYGPVFFDNGYPDWMTITDGLPNLWEVGFPTQQFVNPALNRAFDHLWANDLGASGAALQTDDAAILAHVASALRDEPGILGYEIINEPWPGSQYPTCLDPATGCPAFDQGLFSAYYQGIIPAVRSADPAHLIWYEPLVTFNQGVPTHVMPPNDPKLGFAFHDYSLCGAGEDAVLRSSDQPPVGTGNPCQSQDATVLSNAVARSAATGDALLETEFGASMDASRMTALVTQYDQSMMPWMYWSYTRHIVALASDGTLLAPTDPNVNKPLVDALARPYPQLVSGTPLSWSFDPSTKVFTMRYSTSRADGGGSFSAGPETDVAVPAVQYPNGYGVAVEGGTVRSMPGDALLKVSACPGASLVTVTISPSPANVSSSCEPPT